MPALGCKLQVQAELGATLQGRDDQLDALLKKYTVKQVSSQAPLLAVKQADQILHCCILPCKLQVQVQAELEATLHGREDQLDALLEKYIVKQIRACQLAVSHRSGTKPSQLKLAMCCSAHTCGSAQSLPVKLLRRHSLP